MKCWRNKNIKKRNVGKQNEMLEKYKFKKKEMLEKQNYFLKFKWRNRNIKINK